MWGEWGKVITEVSIASSFSVIKKNLCCDQQFWAFIQLTTLCLGFNSYEFRGGFKQLPSEVNILLNPCVLNMEKLWSEVNNFPRLWG